MISHQLYHKENNQSLLSFNHCVIFSYFCCSYLYFCMFFCVSEVLSSFSNSINNNRIRTKFLEFELLEILII